LLCLRNARAFPLLPAALASVPFGFVLVRVRVVDLHHAFRHHITSASLLRRLGILGIGSYFHNRVLRWAGHVARMPT